MRHDVETREVVVDLSAVDACEQIAEATTDLEIGMMISNAASEPQGPFLELPLE